MTDRARPIGGPAAWRAEDLARSTDWIWEISAESAREIEAALRAVQRRQLPWPAIRKEDFAVPSLVRPLAEISRVLEQGHGVALLRGLPVERFSEEELKHVYWGLGVHLGTPRYQNAHGELLGEVRDEVRRYGDVRQPGVA